MSKPDAKRVIEIKSASSEKCVKNIRWVVEECSDKVWGAGDCVPGVKLSLPGGRSCTFHFYPVGFPGNEANPTEVTQSNIILTRTPEAFNATVDISVVVTSSKSIKSKSSRWTLGKDSPLPSYRLDLFEKADLVNYTGNLIIEITLKVALPGVNTQILDARKSLVSPKKTLKYEFSALYEKIAEDMPGVIKFEVNNHFILAYSLVLQARSSVFRAMLATPMTEKARQTINITDVEYPLMQAFVQFLHTDKIDENLLSKKTSQLLAVADKYDVPQLVWLCESHMLSGLSVTNACELLMLVDTHNRSEARKLILDYIVKNISEVELTDEYERCCEDQPQIIAMISKARRAARTPEAPNNRKRKATAD